MPSMIVGYVPGSGFQPIFSGGIWSGLKVPVGGIQLRADNANSGRLFVSLSGAFVFSGQIGCIPQSGGPTITSGTYPLSGGFSSGQCDGFVLNPSDSYFIPSIALFHQPVQSGLFGSGTFQVCVGADPGCSGTFGRIYFEAL